MVDLDAVAAIRRFNRFYTRAIGVLGQGHLGSPYTLAETRVLYEIVRREPVTPKVIMDATGLDRSYLSRIVKRLEQDGLASRSPTPDARTFALVLTSEGRALYRRLYARNLADLDQLLAGLGAPQRQRLAELLGEVESVLRSTTSSEVILRNAHLGDIGWIVQRHGLIYADEFGWDERFEALSARIAGEFFESFDAACERVWIAERAGQNLGCVFLQKGDATTAKLRLLLVEPSGRGLGLGKRLVTECIAQARAFGYAELALWTQDVLFQARRLYAACGFELIESWPNTEFADLGLVSETWRLKL